MSPRTIVLAVLAFATGCHEHETLPPVPASSASPMATDATTSSAEPEASPPPDALGAVPKRVTAEDKVMGTHVALAAYTTPELDEAAVKRAFAASVAELRRLEALMTTWQPDSELSRVNAAAGKSPVAVSQETFDVVKEAVHASEISEGTFDITFESLHGLWKFDQDLDPHPPTDAQIKSKLPFVGYRHIHLDPD